MLSIKFIVLCSNKWIDISVPCRGTAFLNRALHSALRLRLVSVPCRGTAFLNCSWNRYRLGAKVSVPCRGTAFLN